MVIMKYVTNSLKASEHVYDREIRAKLHYYLQFLSLSITRIVESDRNYIIFFKWTKAVFWKK